MEGNEFKHLREWIWKWYKGARKYSHSFSQICLAVSAISLSNLAYANVGAITPFTSYEAEAGSLGGGTMIVNLTSAPTTEYSSPQLEASGHAYVQLAGLGQYVEWTNSTGQNITALNLRYCIPDAPTGGGISNTIELYVNGLHRQTFSVNSLQSYCYEGADYNGQTDKNPTDGDSRGFWNDSHTFITGAPVAPGDTIRFEMDSSNTAAFYYLDVVDLENPPAPLTQPANSLSILSYGAVSNSPSTDNTTAINTCFSTARSQGKIAWIPPGTFYFSAVHGGLNASGITIVGAGTWYSTLYRVTPNNNSQGVANIITTISCTLSNVSLDCNANSRAGNNNNGAVNFYGTNWVVDNVWIQHVTSAFWCAGVGGTARNCRVLSVWSDGGNFNNVQSDNGIGMNLTYSNNFVRGTGDDAMAINSVNYNVNGSTTTYYTMMSNIMYVNNTATAPWGGKGIGIYGGINDIVTNNLLRDTARYIGLGVMKFGVNGSDLLSATVTGNTVLRCGGNGYNQQQQAMMIGNGGDGQSVGTIANAYCASNTIIDSLYDAVGFSTSTNIVFEYNAIIDPGLDGIAVGPPDLGSGVAGYAAINFNSVTGLNSGRSAFVNTAGNYITGGTGNIGFSVPSPTPSPWLGQDIGSVAATGGDSYSKNTFTLVSSGADIGSTSDAFHYIYQPASGNCLFSTRVVTEELIYPSTKAGVMIRNSLDPADMEASVVVTPDNGILFEWRSIYGNATSSFTIRNLTAPYWVQLRRNGNAFTASYSPDGQTWTTIGTPTTIPMQANVFIGLAVSSHSDGNVSSAMMDNVATVAPAPPYAAVHFEGDLIANLQSSDLTTNSNAWTNRTSNANSVGNFSTVNGNKLNATSLTWNSQAVSVLFINQTVGNAVQSAVLAPVEILTNGPVSAEAWIYATAVNEQNSCAIGYGIQGGSSFQQADREFNYSVLGSGGGVSGDFGSYDTQWVTTPAPGAWHYLAWTYDGSTVRLYLDGVLNAVNSPNTPLQTPPTVIGIGAGLASGPNLGADPFQGYIAAARIESGVLTANDIATNYALGLLATATAVVPTGLSAVDGDGEVTLTWNASGNASSYNVKRSTISNGTYTVIATNITGLSFTNTGLENGTTYYFVVSAVNPAGESGNTAPVSAQPVSLAQPQINFAANGNQMQIAWSQDHLGWLLQVQTNSVGSGLGTNWVTLPGSMATNQMTITMNPTNGSVFFRLTYP
jgi:regulation of enolase protein 1 (concanavalin A-like superfamily)